MKRFFLILTVVTLTLTLIAGCAANTPAQGNNNAAAADENATPDSSDVKATVEKLNVVCTIFPQYDWVRNLIKGREDRYDLTLLQTSAVDLHSFQPTVDDIVKISNCDLFIYVGGESDAWVENALSEAKNKDMVVINLLEELGELAVTEELVEGMEEEEGHDHGTEGEHDDEHDHEEDEHEEEHVEDEHADDEHAEDEHAEEEHAEDEHAEDEHAEDEHAEDEHAEDEHTHDGEAVLDEHVWLSFRNARVFSEAIAGALSRLDNENNELYINNQRDYAETQIAPLEAAYAESLEGIRFDTLVFGDRFPFRYLTDECNLKYFAAFPGCSADTEASFDTIIFLANKTDELNLETVMVTESSDKTIAQTIVDNTGNRNQQILELNSMQSVSTIDADKHTFISIMTENLEVLKQALL
jgi:zinc transport system substrate-binding protein